MQPDCLNCGTLNQVLQGPTCAPGEPDCVNWYDLAGAMKDCGTCGPQKHGKPPRKKPPPLLPPPCVGMQCGTAPIGGGGTLIVLGCAPCEDGHVPPMPDCSCDQAPNCGCGLEFCICEYEQCISGGWPGVTGLSNCVAQLGACKQRPPACPAPAQVVSRTIEIGPQPAAPSCAAGEHPAPCEPGEALDLSTGCCATPSNVLELPPVGGGVLELPPIGPAFELPPGSAQSDFLAAIAA